MSPIECSAAKERRIIAILLFIIGVGLVAFEMLILLGSMYSSHPIIDDIALWMYVTGAFVIIFIIAILLLIIGAWMHVVSTKRMTECGSL